MNAICRDHVEEREVEHAQGLEELQQCRWPVDKTPARLELSDLQERNCDLDFCVDLFELGMSIACGSLQNAVNPLAQQTNATNTRTINHCCGPKKATLDAQGRHLFVLASWKSFQQTAQSGPLDLLRNSAPRGAPLRRKSSATNQRKRSPLETCGKTGAAPREVLPLERRAK